MQVIGAWTAGAIAAIAVMACPAVAGDTVRSERIMLGGILDRDPAQVCEFGDRRLAAEAAVAAALDAAEGHLRLIMHRRTIDVADAGFDPRRDCHGPLDVAAMLAAALLTYLLAGERPAVWFALASMP